MAQPLPKQPDVVGQRRGRVARGAGPPQPLARGVRRPALPDPPLPLALAPRQAPRAS